MIAITEHYVTSGSARLWTCASGNGIPLLLFNGGPGCDDYLGPVASLIDDRCHVIRFEPRGCGRSDWDGRYNLDTLLDDAETVHQAYGATPCIVAGHSFGANAALAYALRHPTQILGLIGIAGGRLVNDRTWSAAYHRGLQEVGEQRRGIVFTADERVNHEGNRSWQVYIQRPTLFREVADLTIPATFINADADIRPNWPTRQLAALLSQGHYVEIPGVAHYVWLTHAVTLQRALREAIARIRPHSGITAPRAGRLSSG